MGTRGFIGLKAEGTTISTYNHYDSYPSYLGVNAAKFIREADVSQVAERLVKLVRVSEDGKPTPEQLEDLKARGFWENVSLGDDWYAALRNCQGDLEQYLSAGYIPALNFDPLQATDTWMEWGYIVDLDTEELHVYEYVDSGQPPVKRISIPFEKIRDWVGDPVGLFEFEGAY